MLKKESVQDLLDNGLIDIIIDALCEGHYSGVKFYGKSKKIIECDILAFLSDLGEERTAFYLEQIYNIIGRYRKESRELKGPFPED